MNPTRLKRGAISERHPGRVFLSYSGVQEIWVTPERLSRVISQMKTAYRKWSDKQKAKWKLALQSKVHKRGDVRGGVVFWGMSRGKERWVTEGQFEYLRKQKNCIARGKKRTPEQRERENALARLRPRTPEQRARYAARQREKRHIYSPRGRARRRAYKKMRRQTDPVYRMAANLSNRMRNAFKFVGGKKNSPTQELIGCTHDFFRGWLESQFVEGMSWENYGKTWSVDHKTPIISFDILDPIEQRKAFHYSNCRPLFKSANSSKSDRMEFEGRTVRAGHLRKQNIIPFVQAA